MNTKERLLLFLQHLNIGQNKFEKSCGLSSGSISSMKEAPNGTSLIKIARAYPELSLDWLLLGQGEMLRSNDFTEKTPDVEVEETICELPQKRNTDNMDVVERLELYIRSKGMGNYQFEKKVGLSQGYIKRVRNCLHPEKIKRIANVFPDLNIEWMIIGRGEMIVNTANRLYENEIYRLLKEQNDLQQDMINKLRIELSEIKTRSIALDKDNKKLVKNLHEMSEIYAEQISNSLMEIKQQLTA
ncbi:MAG: hypothetical protein E7110_01710 [Bacteroidales bacterium]|nr:hypothetical protein [Bacteroidales bacterium]